MKRYILLALSVCQSLVVLAAEAPRKSTDANLFGHVVDRETHEHLPYATVAVTGTAFGTTTDASGHYFLKNLPEGELTLEVRALGYAGYYEAHPEKPEEPCREDFIEEVDYTESMNTFRSALDEYEQECADRQRRVEAGELIRYAVIGDRSIEFCYDEPIPVKEEQNEVIRFSKPVRIIRRYFQKIRLRLFPTSCRSPAKALIRKRAKASISYVAA